MHVCTAGVSYRIFEEGEGKPATYRQTVCLITFQVCSLANFGNFQQACFLPVLATSCSNIWSILDITKCGYFCTPPNVATFGAPKDITKCGYFRTPPNVWQHFGYYQMWLLLYSTKCDKHLEHPRILPNVATCTPPNVATFGVPLDITKCGYFCQMWQHLEYPWILPNVATSDSTKCGNTWSTHGYYQLTVATSVHFWKCSQRFHVWTLLVLQVLAHSAIHRMPLLDISISIPNVATFGGVRSSHVW